jgi:hypothetical protein
MDSTRKIVFDSRREMALYRSYRSRGASPNEIDPINVDTEMGDASPISGQEKDQFNTDEKDTSCAPPSQALEMQGILASYFSDLFPENNGIPVILSKWPEAKKENKLVCKGPIRRKNGRPLPEDNLMMKFSFK